MVASTGVWIEAEDEQYSLLRRQALFTIGGLILAFILSGFRFEVVRPYTWWIIGGAALLLALCYVPGIGREVNGARRWINLGFQFQPSECAKICLIIFLAHWYAKYRDSAATFVKGFLWPGIVFAFIIGLIFFEKDMGTAAALGVAGFCVIFAAGANLIYLGLSCVLGLIIGGYFILGNENRMGRIEAWRDPEAYMSGAGLQQAQAKLAMELGGLNGTGLGNSTVKHGSLPFAHTDFIFAPLGEEFGLWGTMGVLLCFSLFCFAGISLAIQTKDPFYRLLVVGIIAIIFCPAMLNIAVVTAALPNTGLPLPFISFGGTNLVFSLGALGILTSIQRHSPVPLPQYDILSGKKEASIDVRL